ncbi:acaloleptin A-like [Anoplophora glabripennis]|uniref:acaloleptin A-like n=1 Tax=Anoplophora glabripennis TaxID=217634 RepID=UPI00087384DB|nr:acaloleptin A-like [Anoplophora glabripennis]
MKFRYIRIHSVLFHSDQCNFVNIKKMFVNILFVLLTALMVTSMDDNELWDRDLQYDLNNIDDYDYTECDDSENIKPDVNFEHHQENRNFETDWSKFVPIGDAYRRSPELDNNINEINGHDSWNLGFHEIHGEDVKETQRWQLEPILLQNRN